MVVLGNSIGLTGIFFKKTLNVIKTLNVFREDEFDFFVKIRELIYIILNFHFELKEIITVLDDTFSLNIYSSIFFNTSTGFDFQK